MMKSPEAAAEQKYLPPVWKRKLWIHNGENKKNKNKKKIPKTTTTTTKQNQKPQTKHITSTQRWVENV